MNVTIDKFLSLVEKPDHKDEINKARKDDESIRFHTVSVDRVDSSTKNDAHKSFWAWVTSVIEAQGKLKRFTQFCTYPFYTNEITDSAFKDLKKVFEAQNSNFTYQADEDIKTDWIEYLTKIKDKQFWQMEAWSAIMNSINSVLIIDMSSTPSSSLSEPYWFLVDMKDIIDIKNTKVSKIDQKTGAVSFSFKTEYIIFKKNGKVYAIDDEKYLVFDRDNKGKIIKAPSANISHKLEYTPAKQLYTDPYNTETTIRKKGPISASLGSLDLILYSNTAESFADNYVPFPIISKYATKCDYFDPKSEAVCQGGFVPVETEQNPFDPENPKFYRCPDCANDSEVFAGSEIIVDPPREGQPDQLEAVKIIQPPVEGIKYYSGKKQQREQELFWKVVGKTFETNNDQSQNESQIRSRFESRQSVLRQIANNIEIIMEFAHQTGGLLRYGPIKFKGASIFLGDQYFFHTVEDLNRIYKDEKSNGLSETELSLTRDRITHTKYKNNKELQGRVQFLNRVEPYIGKTLTELTLIQEKFPESVEQLSLKIKINFDNYIKKYEIEVEPLRVTIENSDSIESAIKKVNDQLIIYATPPKGDEKDPIPLAALNGAQVTSMVTVVQAFQAGQIPQDSAVEMLRQSFGYTLEAAKKIVGNQITQPPPPE